MIPGVAVRISGVYLITHNPTGRAYIGSSDHIYRRWAAHKSVLHQGTHKNAALQRDWNEYGPDAFTFGIVETVRPEGLADAENRWLREWTRPRYNLLGRTTRRR